MWSVNVAPKTSWWEGVRDLGSVVSLTSRVDRSMEVRVGERASGAWSSGVLDIEGEVSCFNLRWGWGVRRHCEGRNRVIGRRVCLEVRSSDVLNEDAIVSSQLPQSKIHRARERRKGNSQSSMARDSRDRCSCARGVENVERRIRSSKFVLIEESTLHSRPLRSRKARH